MNCNEAIASIALLLDGELDALRAAEVEQHLAECAACRTEHAAQLALRDAIRSKATYHPAPAALRARVSDALRKAAPASRRPPKLRWEWGLAFAAGILVTLAGSLVRTGDPEFERELVSAHVRSLMATHLSDVVSSDRHTVKPWFAGKLDFAPPVRDLAAQDFPLVGGRLDYLGDRAVAALVYKRRGHVINLFVWPARDAGDSAPSRDERNGYSLVRWRHDGMNFSAVSDLNAQELEEFARRLIAPEATG
jgi:mycothiol system anti-sigma-R factor